jgi:hypothetical protein
MRLALAIRLRAPCGFTPCFFGVVLWQQSLKIVAIVCAASP